MYCKSNHTPLQPTIQMYANQQERTLYVERNEYLWRTREISIQQELHVYKKPMKKIHLYTLKEK